MSEDIADEAAEKPAGEIAEGAAEEPEDTADETTEEPEMATDENVSNAAYTGRTVEITSDLKKAAENKNSAYKSKEASNQENAADDDTLKNQVQMALDGFVNEGNKPSETIDSSARDDNEDDSEDDDLQFIDLN